MPNKLNILSYHLLLETNNNRFGNRLNDTELAEIKKADMVIVPQGCNKQLYDAVSLFCPHVFPNYDALFHYPGKIGQAHLFQNYNVPHPATQVFADVSVWQRDKIIPSFPFVFKLSWGGEGRNVFLVENETAFEKCIDFAEKYEKEQRKGFLFQEYIPANGRSLRVVVMAGTFISYWRCQEGEDCFYTNLARGASIDYDFAPELQQAAIRALKKFCRETKINLAGFDFLFDFREKTPVPLFLEINYCFRSHGLGGPDAYLELLTLAVQEWIASLS